MTHETAQALLAFAEAVANSTSANLHDFHSEIVIDARHVVKAAGGHLRKVGRFEEGSAAQRPHEHFNGKSWVRPHLNRKTDTWEWPE